MTETTALTERPSDLPDLAGNDAHGRPPASTEEAVYLPHSQIDFGRVKSAFAIALHMHQPLVPLGGDDLRSARIISNLQYMMEHPNVGDNHNATVFHQCYKRMGEFIPALVNQGHNPRVMLDYSGTLLHGL